MNELMNELLELNAYASKRLVKLNAEVEEIEEKEKLSGKDKKKLKELKEDSKKLISLKEDLTKDFEKINALENKITERDVIISKTKDNSVKLMHQDKLDELKKEEELLEAELRSFYAADLDYIKSLDETTEEVVEETSKKKTSGKTVVSVVALLAAAGLGFGVSKIDLSKITTKANNKPETTDEQNSEETKTTETKNETIEETKNETVEEMKELDYSKMTPLYDEEGNLYGYYDSETNTVVKPEVKEVEVVEITDELIAEVADKAAKEINENLPGYGITAETMDEMIRWINALPVEEATLEAQRAYMDELRVLLANDTNAKEVFDYSQLVLKPNANKLAKQMVEVRKDAVAAIGIEKTEEVANELAELLTKMTKHVTDKEGDKLHNVMDLGRLESNASKSFALYIFGSTYAKLDNTRNGVYVDKDGFEHYLRQDWEAMNTESFINYEKETNIGSAGDGCEYETIDYISYLGRATLEEAEYLKAQGYTLSK